jgi:putative transposase
VIPESVQLIAARTGEEFNVRKKRKGAFWEDRYHATAVEGDSHLIHCMVYIDLNMVRAGVVGHPSGWAFGGYNEIQNPRERYSLVDHETLMELVGIKSVVDFKKVYDEWIDEALGKKQFVREPRWTESVAIGSEVFVENVKDRLGIRGLGRKVIEDQGVYELREPQASYCLSFESLTEHRDWSSQNRYYWDRYGRI